MYVCVLCTYCRRDAKITTVMASDHVVNRVFHTVDSDGSGSIECKEFIQWVNSGQGSFSNKPNKPNKSNRSSSPRNTHSSRRSSQRRANSPDNPNDPRRSPNSPNSRGSSPRMNREVKGRFEGNNALYARIGSGNPYNPNSPNSPNNPYNHNTILVLLEHNNIYIYVYILLCVYIYMYIYV